MDADGRVVYPEELRQAIGLVASGTGEVTVDGADLSVAPSRPTATLHRVDGHLVADGSEEYTDELQFGLIDACRR